MKKLLGLVCLLWSVWVNAQTFPVQNLQVNGTSTFAGNAAFSGLSTFSQQATFSNGVVAPGTNSINGYAPTASPTFTGVPTVPTASSGTNSVQIANAAFVANHAPCPSILDNGGNNTNSADNTAAFAATAALGPAGQACVYFPPGTYAFSGQVIYNMPSTTSSIRIEGAGIGMTKLQWAAGGGLKINYQGGLNSVVLGNFSVLTGTTNTGTGLWINNTGTSLNAMAALSILQNISINGSDGVAGTNYWATGLQVSNVSNVNFINLNVVGQGATYQSNGVGVALVGSSPSSEAVALNFYGLYADYVGTGMSYGTNVQGVTITNGNFTGDTLGINVPTPLQNQSGLTVIGSQFNCLQYEIYDQVGIQGLVITGNYFELPYNGGSTVVAVYLLKVGQGLVTGNVIERVGATATGLNGIIIGGSASVIGMMISGNNIFAVITGVWLQSGSTNVNVQSNFYTANGSNVVNSCSSGCLVGVASP